MRKNIGIKLKKLRISKNLTLKDLSELTELSTSFLSQLERGINTVAVDALSDIAKKLDVDLYYFIEDTESEKPEINIVKSYEREIVQIDDNHFIHYSLSNYQTGKKLMPRIIELAPTKSHEKTALYPHGGEEFIYILEGILTLYLSGKVYDLYPGDSAHYDSKALHNWANSTSMLVKLICINTSDNSSH